METARLIAPLQSMRYRFEMKNSPRIYHTIHGPPGGPSYWRRKISKVSGKNRLAVDDFELARRERTPGGGEVTSEEVLDIARPLLRRDRKRVLLVHVRPGRRATTPIALRWAPFEFDGVPPVQPRVELRGSNASSDCKSPAMSLGPAEFRD